MTRRRNPIRSSRTAQALVAAVVGLLLAAPVLADEPDPIMHPTPASEGPFIGDKVMDAILVRPLSAVATLAGAILFVPAAAMASPKGKSGIQGALDQFVLLPWDYTVSRPLGDF